MTNINIGCGNYPIIQDSWINLDKKGLYQKWEDTLNRNLIEEFDMTKFPYKFDNDSQDLILFSHSLNQVKQHERIFKECYRVLKNCGRLIIKDDDNFHPQSKYVIPHKHTQTIMSPSHIRYALEKIGFKIDYTNKTTVPDNHPKSIEGVDKFTIEAIKNGAN